MKRDEFFKMLVYINQEAKNRDVKIGGGSNSTKGRYSRFMTDDEVLNIGYYEFFRVLLNGELDPKHLYLYVKQNDSNDALFDYFMASYIDYFKEFLRSYEAYCAASNSDDPQIRGEALTVPELVEDINSNPSFKTLFKVDNFTDYLDILTEVEPNLLEKSDNGKYKFVGNPYIQKGCVASFFKLLKGKGIIDQNANRDQIANILNIEIENYSISHTSIDNDSKLYEKTFYPQIKLLLKDIKNP